jgi:hypothetical protein
MIRLIFACLLAATLSACSLNFVGVPTPIASAIDPATPPVVVITAPRVNAAYAEGVDVIVQALIANAGADVVRVDVAINGEVFASIPDAALEPADQLVIAETWQAQAAGEYIASVIAVRSNGVQSAESTVLFRVVRAESFNVIPTLTPTPITPTAPIPPTDIPTQAPTETPTDTPTPAPTDPSLLPTPDPSGVIATFSQGLNVRSGPGVEFAPPIGSFAAGQSANITGRTEDSSWLRVRYYFGEGWVFAALVQITGDLNAVPVVTP